MARLVRLLGIGPLAMAEALRLAVGRQAGPPLVEHRVATPAGGFVALAQQEPPAAPRRPATQAAALRDLATLQRRLEAACLTAPFLPAAPATALCPAAELPGLLAAAAPALLAALAQDGATHQWQLTLRWAPEAVLAAQRASLAAAAAAGPAALAAAVAATLRADRDRRDAALAAALRPVVRGLLPQPAGDCEASVCLLVPRGGEAAIETALGALPAAVTDGASADLRGPLPPVSFAAWRIAEADHGAVRDAWDLLGLPERIDGPALAQRWRQQAAAIHPDRTGAPADGAAMAGLGAAHRLLRELATEPGSSGLALPDLLRRAGRRLVPSGPEHRA